MQPPPVDLFVLRVKRFWPGTSMPSDAERAPSHGWVEVKRGMGYVPINQQGRVSRKR